MYQFDLEEPACCGYQGYFTDLGAECREELLPELWNCELGGCGYWWDLVRMLLAASICTGYST